MALSSSENVDEPLKQADTSSDKDELEPAQTNYESEGRRFESCRARPQNPVFAGGFLLAFRPRLLDFSSLDRNLTVIRWCDFAYARAIGVQIAYYGD